MGPGRPAWCWLIAWRGTAPLPRGRAGTREMARSRWSMKSAGRHAMPPPGMPAVRNVVTAVRGCIAGVQRP